MSAGLDRICRVCQKTKRQEEMRKTIHGRTTKYCYDCEGLYRCSSCGEVKEEKHFLKHGSRKVFFDDGSEERCPICYSCDYRIGKKRYDRYDKKVQRGKTIRHIILSNLQGWKSRCRKMGWKFDLSMDFLVSLWEKQKGKCFYTGDDLTLDRVRKVGSSASLDRMDSSKGYVMGNVVWTSRLVNVSKGQRNVKDFVVFCRKIVSHLQKGLP